MSRKVVRLIDTQTVLEDSMRDNIAVLEKALADEKKKLEKLLSSKRKIEVVSAPVEIVPKVVGENK